MDSIGSGAIKMGEKVRSKIYNNIIEVYFFNYHHLFLNV